MVTAIMLRIFCFLLLAKCVENKIQNCFTCGFVCVWHDVSHWRKNSVWACLRTRSGESVVMKSSILMLFFWLVTPCGLVGRYRFSEKYTVTIFQAKVRTDRVRFSKTSVFIYEYTWLYNPDEHRHLHVRENLESHTGTPQCLFFAIYCRVIKSRIMRGAELVARVRALRNSNIT